MLKWIGSFTLAVITLLIPILTTLAIVYDWHTFFKTILVVLSLGMIPTFSVMYYELED